MKSRTEIEQKVLSINEILINSRKLAFDSFKMLVVDSIAKHELIFRNKFLMRIRESFWKLAIIELTKILGSKKEHHKIEKVINFLINQYGNSDWKSDITLSELNGMLSKLRSDDVSKRIERLLIIRDQHYAHKDANPENNIYEIKFYYEDFQYLLEIGEGIMEKIMNLLFEKDFVFAKYNGEQANDFFSEVIETRTELTILKIKNKGYNSDQ